MTTFILPKTDKYCFEPLTESDTQLVIRLFNDPDCLRFIGDKNIRNERDSVKYLQTGPMAMYQEHGFGLYKVIRKNDRVCLGLCGLLQREYLEYPDVGCAFLPDYRKAGAAYDCCSAVTQWALSVVNANKVLALISPDNSASIGLFSKMNYQLIDTIEGNDIGQKTLIFAYSKQTIRFSGGGSVQKLQR
jgi:RimJ/RimL family protein N-acetyltransferase